jgi:hypothetical protein
MGSEITILEVEERKQQQRQQERPHTQWDVAVAVVDAAC